MTPSAATPPGSGNDPNAPNGPPASYLDRGEEWESPAPEPLVPREKPVPPSPVSPVEQSAQTAPGEGLAVRGKGRGHVRGIARSVQVRTKDGDTAVLSFRVDQYDAAGNRMQPVGVELQWYRSGQLSDGEEVDAVGRWSDGTLQARRIVNRSTGAQIKGLPRWAFRFTVAVALIFVGGILAFIAYGVATTP